MISENIRMLLLCLLNDEVIVASWGISNINISKTKLSFSVCGFKYQGRVTITVRGSSNCEIFLNKAKLGCFNIDKVVSIIDENVENSEICYRDYVKQWINEQDS